MSTEYELKKHHPGCTGMFWRSDPSGASNVASNSDWPRDGAKLTGDIVEYNGKKWLQVLQIKQARSAEWVDVPQGAFIPFEYDDHYYLEE